MSDKPMFTPGPWHWSANSASDPKTICIDIETGGEYRGDIAHLQSAGIENGITIAETKANARLIAASPAMYDFVKKCAAKGNREAIGILESIHA